MNKAISLNIGYQLVLILTTFALTSPSTAQEQNEKPIELSGFSISQAYDIEDDVELSIDEAMLIRLAYRIKKTSPKSRREYTRYSESVAWDSIVAKTDDYRFWLFAQKGRVKDITRIPLAGASSDSEIKELFVCHCKTNEEAPFVVIANTLPSLLKQKATTPGSLFDEPIGFSGFLYSRAKIADRPNQPTPVFIADRLSWFPEAQNFDSLVDSHLALSENGFDIGLLDVIKKSNTKPLESRDAEAFFQMLATTGKIERTQWDDGIEFQELMQKASTSFGKPISIKGTIRTCSVIHDIDDDIKNRLGIEKYYQLILFPDLGGKKIVIKHKGGEDDINDRFPITICCTRLPDGLEPSDVERQKVRIDGFVYRFWKFQSERTDQRGFAGQVSPLIMTRQPTILIDQGSAKVDRILLGFVLFVIFGIGAMIYAFRRSDQRDKTAGQKILDGLPDQIDVAGISD